MNRAGRAGIIAALLVLALAPFVHVACAQTGAPADTSVFGGTGGSSLQAVADSANRAHGDSTGSTVSSDSTGEGEPQPGALIRPTYKSSYSVNRTLTKWGQDLTFTVPFGPFTLSHTTSGDLSHDTGVTGLRTRGLTSRTEFSYEVGGGAFSVGAVYERPRDHFSDINLNSATDKTNLSLQSTYKVKPWSDLNLTLTGSGGQAGDHFQQLTYTRLRNVSYLGKTATTHGDGLSGGLNGTVDFTPRGRFAVNSSYNLTRSRLQTDETVIVDTSVVHDDSSSVSSFPSYDSKNDVHSTLTFTPLPILVTTVSASGTNSQDQYYADAKGFRGQETRSTSSHGFGVHGALSGARKVDLGVSVASTDVTYAHHTNRSSMVDDVRLDADWDTRLLTFDVKGTFSTDNARNVFPRLGAATSKHNLNGNTYTRGASLTLARAVNRRTSTRATGSVSLIRYVYDNGLQDRDVGSSRAALDIDYTPGKKVSLGLEIGVTTNQSVNIRAAGSANNTTEHIYNLQPALTYKLSSRTSVSQAYSILSDYTFYAFDENRNNYVGTTGVTTTIASALSRRLSMSFSHFSQLRQNGSYIFDPTLGGRAFGVANQNHNQDLTAGITYQLGRAFTLSTSQRLNVISSYTCKEECTQNGTTRRLDLTGTTNLQHTLSDGTSINVSVRRLESNAEKSYWSATADLSHMFFR